MVKRKAVSKIPENIRYVDKKYLMKYDLYVDLFKIFDLKVTDVIPLRSVFLLFTDKGKKILKKVEYGKEDLEFIYSAVKYIKESFPRVMNFTLTKDGNIYALWKGDMYCVLDLVEGRECEFSNPLDIAITAKALGQLHIAGEGFRYDTKEKKQVGRAIDIFSRRLDEMRFFKRIANMHEIKNDFDRIFLDNADYYINEIEKSIHALKKSSYLKLCGEEDKIAICHNDLAHHNIIINNDEAYFIDFDYSVIDLKVQDLSNFINKAIKNFAFDINRANDILSNYCIFSHLDKREKEVLKALQMFPEDFFNISKDYYSRRKDWDEEVFLDRIIRKSEFREDREEFLESFLKE